MPEACVLERKEWSDKDSRFMARVRVLTQPLLVFVRCCRSNFLCLLAKYLGTTHKPDKDEGSTTFLTRAAEKCGY